MTGDARPVKFGVIYREATWDKTAARDPREPPNRFQHARIRQKFHSQP